MRPGRNKKPELVEREQGFNVFFSGANKVRADEKNLHMRHKSKKPKSKTQGDRKPWIRYDHSNDEDDEPYSSDRYDEGPRISNKVGLL